MPPGMESAGATKSSPGSVEKVPVVCRGCYPCVPLHLLEMVSLPANQDTRHYQKVNDMLRSSCYRVAELSTGWGSETMRNEGHFIIMESESVSHCSRPGALLTPSQYVRVSSHQHERLLPRSFLSSIRTGVRQDKLRAEEQILGSRPSMHQVQPSHPHADGR